MNDLSPADVTALSNGGTGGMDHNGWWIILLFILLGGWGNRGLNGAGSAGGDALYPWLNQSEQVSNGFAAAATQLCNCCSDMQMALASGFAGVEAGANARQVANMQQAFAAQTAISQGFANIGLGMANQTATILAENCADRAALNDGVRDIIASQTAGTQRIIDWLCQDKIDQKNDEIARLRQEAYMKDLAASQVAQNAFIQQGFANEVDQLYNRLNNCPVPTTPVYGRTPIFTCGGSCGCGNGTIVG